MSSRNLIHMFASALLSCEWNAKALVAQTEKTFGGNYKWIGPLVRRVLEYFPNAPRPRLTSLKQMLRDDEGFTLARKRNALMLVELSLSPPRMAPVTAAAGWNIPPLTTEGDLCRWLQISPEYLDRFADIHRHERFCDSEPLRNYAYRWLRSALAVSG